jgi:3-oxoacyl-[acyl-carrier-protein] synthase-3
VTVPGFGALALGTALGEPLSVRATVDSYVDDPERVLEWGYHTYHRAAPGTSATRLGARAAEAALRRAGVTAGAVDALVAAVSDVPEYLQWDPSAALARELDIHRAPTLLLTQGCAAAVVGFQQVAGWLAVRPDVDTVLLVATNLVSEAHSNRMRFNTCLASDGAAAVLLRRGHPRLRWLVTEQVTDPRWVDFFRLEYGGSAVPVAPGPGGNREVDPLALVHRRLRRSPADLAGFAAAMSDQLAVVVDRACVRAGVAPAALARFIYLNDNQASMAEVARSVGVPAARTNADLAAGLGHCGAADQLLCLDAYLAAGELAAGDVVALAGVSSGMHWFCTLLAV